MARGKGKARLARGVPEARLILARTIRACHVMTPAPPPLDDAQARLAAIVESSDDAIIGKTPEGIITSWNPGAERMFGHTTAAMVGRPMVLIFPPERADEEREILGRVGRGEHVRHFDTVRVHRDGHRLDVSVMVSPIRDPSGRVIGISTIARDITEEKIREREHQRITRLYAALSQINQAIVMAPTRGELFGKICRVLITHGGFRMAWIGWEEPESRRLLPAADCGDEDGYVRGIRIYTDDRPEGRGPSGTAFRENRTYVCNDILDDPSTVPWREEMRRRGFRASAALPIRLNARPVGALTIYADEPGYFQDKEIALLEEAAGDVSFALGNFAREEARRQAEEAALREEHFSHAMIESMPGVVYFYDKDGRFLRWNRNFEAVSGYTAEEIARMHPLDFFAEREKALLKARIGDVFEKGESTVEAPFIAKDGSATAYFFTGKRILYDGEMCLVGMGVDISERKRAEEALRVSEQKLRSVFEQAPLGMAVLDSHSGRFLQINGQYCRITGYSESEMLGLTFHEITHPNDIERDTENMLRLQEGKQSAFQIEKRYFRKDGSLVWVRLTCVPLWREDQDDRQHIAMVEDITERRQAEQLVAESERRYRELVERANSIILRWNAEGKITFLNEFGQRVFGFPGTEIIGRHVVGTIVPRTESSGRDLQRLMEEICADPKAFEQSVNENMRRDGERLWIAWTNRIVRDERGGVAEIFSVGTDITERRRAEEALRASEERYRTTLDSMMEGCQLLGFDWRYLYVNDAAAAHNRRPKAELLGRTMQEAWPGIEASAVFAMFRRSMEERVALHDETEFEFPDGHKAWFDVRCQPAPEGVFVLSVEISERKQAEMALRVLNQTLELQVAERTAALKSALVRAEAADRIKSAFLATMSHELRTPLNSIIGFTGILLQELAGPLNAEQTKQLGMVRGSARHLLELINDVLDLSKIEAGQLEIRAEPFDLPTSIERVVASVRPLAEKKGLALSAEVAGGLGEMVGDRRRVEQILINLLSNAIKFTERGSVKLAADAVETPDSKTGVRLRVSDTGIGIKPEDIGMLFQPFRQVDTGLSRQHEGTGLGLAICQRLVMLMGGKITTASEWLHGSEFTVTLPLPERG